MKINISQNKVELLAPAGDFEKLKIAILYGADAVYLGGKDFSLRNFSENFTIDEIDEAVRFAHNKGVKIYVACNVYSRNSEQEEIDLYLKKLGDIKPDALIIADTGILSAAFDLIPHIPIHLSTQANTTSYRSVLFWEKFNIARVNIARELSLHEIKEISDRCSMEIEAFVHGSMCISYSGRCLLSSFLANRDSNQGKCAHPCRWKYFLIEELRPDEFMPIYEDKRGSYILNSKDLCMIDYLPDMIKSGINSLKIEGRMKSIHYIATVVNTYRSAIDLYYKDPDNYNVKEYWKDELSFINARGYCTGFYFGNPEQAACDYSKTSIKKDKIFVGKVLKDSTQDNNAESLYTLIEVRNKIYVCDEIEIIKKDGGTLADKIENIYDENMIAIPFAQPNAIVTILTKIECKENDIIRKIKTLS